MFLVLHLRGQVSSGNKANKISMCSLWRSRTNVAQSIFKSCDTTSCRKANASRPSQPSGNPTKHTALASIHASGGTKVVVVDVGE